MLKPYIIGVLFRLPLPAAFGRLCVETSQKFITRGLDVPAAFGRLCVETNRGGYITPSLSPAAFGRLCVETPIYAKT